MVGPGVPEVLHPDRAAVANHERLESAVVLNCVRSFRVHEPGELRLGEGQQRADRFGFDVEHPRHSLRLEALVIQT